MKKILLTLALTVALLCSLAVMISAKEAYLEKIPEELKGTNDAAEYFIVFDGEEYYGGSAGTVNALNPDNIASAIGADGLNINASEIGTKYLTKFIFPSEFGGAELKKVDFNTSGLKRNGAYFNWKCGAVVLPGTVTTVTDMNDCVGQLRSIDFGENSQVSKIPTCFCSKAGNLREVKNFPTNLTSIDSSAFANCRLAFKGELYLNAGTIAHKAFDNCFVNVTGIVFGENVKKIENESLSCFEAGVPKIKYIEFKGDITQINISESLKLNGAFYFGTKDSQRSPLSSLACIILSNPAQADCTGKTFQDYLPKVYFNEASMTTGNPVYSAHSVGSKTVAYEDFFTKSLMRSECSICGCVNEGAVEEPIVQILGYSKSEYGNASMTFGIKIDYSVLNQYNETVSEDKKIISFGLLAANPELVGNNAFDGELVSKKGAINVDLLAFNIKTQYAEIKITGLNGETDYTDKAFYLTAYAVVGGEVVYLDNGTDSLSLSTTVIYNSII